MASPVFIRPLSATEMKKTNLAFSRRMTKSTSLIAKMAIIFICGVGNSEFLGDIWREVD